MRILIFCFLEFTSHFVFSQINGEKPFVLGIVDEIESTFLGERRVLNIYLPEGYNADDTVNYPVVYLLDGSADEDFIHVVGIYQFNNFPWIDRVPKSIIVGIANVDRRRDFTFPTTIKEDLAIYPTTGHSERFIGFLEKELQPYIERTYKVNTDRTIIGQSLGGLLAAEILLTKPWMFMQYIIISPSLWWDNGSIFKSDSGILNQFFTTETSVYIGVGHEDETPGTVVRSMTEDARLLAELIRGAANEKIKVYFDYLPEENHATVAHQAIFNALRMLHPEKRED